MKTLFDVGQIQVTDSHDTLLLELGSSHCATAYFQKSTNRIDGLQLFSLDEWTMAEQLSLVLQPLKSLSFSAVVACVAFSEALLLPIAYAESAADIVNRMYPLPAQQHFQDTLTREGLLTAFLVPQAVCAVLEDVFPNLQYIHAYSVAIQSSAEPQVPALLAVHFSGGQFRVLLKKNSHLQLVQTYRYKTPLDVVYYLLKIRYEFDLSQEDVALILSGLVEKDSQLFTELQQYFSHIQFAELPKTRLPDSPHPHYFFTSLYNLATCV